ncbi:MAG: MFS transporter [Acidimicrobiia bacterium]
METAGARPSLRERWRDRLTAGVTEGTALYPLAVLFGLNAVDELDRTAFNVLTPEIRRDFDLDLSGVLAILSAVEATAILLGIPLAYLADRRRRVRMAAGGAALWGSFSVLTAAATSTGMLAGARAGAGLGRAVTTPTHFSLLADFYPAEVRPKVYGAHRAANSVGQIAGPLLAGTLAFFFGWRAPFVLFAVPTAVLVVAALRLAEPERGAHERRAAGLAQEAAVIEDPAPPFIEACRLLWRIRTLRRIWFALPLAAVLIVGLGAVFSTFYEEEFGLNSAQRGLASALTEPAQLIGLFVGVPVANRLLKRDPALVLRFIAVVGLVVAGAFALLSVTPNLAVVIGLNMLISGSAAVFQPGAFAVVSLTMPPKVRSLGFALSALWILPGLALFPLLGALADESGIRPAFAALAPVLAVAGLLFASAGRYVRADMAAARAVLPS